MNFFDFFKMAFRNLTASKGRSFLTMLGVIIGIFSVITLVSMGEGLKGYMYGQISAMGTGPNYMEVHAGKKGGMGFFGAEITYQDAKAIENQAPSITAVDSRVVRPAKITYGKKSFSAPMVMGVTPAMHEMFNWEVAEGRYLSEVDVNARKRVVALGKNVAQSLFGQFSPLGENVRLDGKNFIVIAVMKEFGASFGVSHDDFALIPVTTGLDVFDTHKLVEIGVLAKSENMLPQAISEISEILIDRHGEEDFRIDTMGESLSILDNVMSILTSIVVGIAAISLFVGGIGIANIMLVAVTERTREIGVRKAVGARNRDIVLQFLAEAIVISFFGGIIGIISGVGLSLLIMLVIGFPLRVSLWSVFVAASVSIIVGIASGVYPAMRAAKLNPVEALRYE